MLAITWHLEVQTTAHALKEGIRGFFECAGRAPAGAAGSLSTGATETCSTKRCARRLLPHYRRPIRHNRPSESWQLDHRGIQRESTAARHTKPAILSCSPAAGRRPASRVPVEAAVSQSKPDASAEAPSRPCCRCQAAGVARLAAARRSEPTPHTQLKQRRRAGSAVSPTALLPARCCRPCLQRAARLLLLPLRLGACPPLLPTGLE